MSEKILVLGAGGMLGKQPNPVHFFAGNDLGEMVARAFRNPEAKNERFVVYGPQALTLKEGLEQYCQALYPESKVSSMPIWLARLIARLTKNEMMAFAADLMGYFDKTPEEGDPLHTEKVLGKAETTLEQFIKNQLNV